MNDIKPIIFLVPVIVLLLIIALYFLVVKKTDRKVFNKFIEALEIIARIETLGGSVAAIEQGFIQREIEDAAYRFQREIEKLERTVVGVNKFQSDSGVKVPIQKIDSSVDERRAAQLKAWREARDQTLTDTALENLRNAANGTQNLFPFVLESFRAQATLGEVCGVLREVWGEYQADV